MLLISTFELVKLSCLLIANILQIAKIEMVVLAIVKTEEMAVSDPYSFDKSPYAHYMNGSIDQFESKIPGKLIIIHAYSSVTAAAYTRPTTQPVYLTHLVVKHVSVSEHSVTL